MNDCHFERETFDSFKRHLYSVHEIKDFNANQLRGLINSDSFFHEYLVLVTEPIENKYPEITMDNFELSVPPNNASIESNSTHDDFVFVKKVAKLAFKYSLGQNVSKTNMFKYFSEMMALMAQESPSPNVLNYAKEVFLNPNRVESYFKTNFSLFSFRTEKLSDDCSVFLTDPYEMISELLSNSFIFEHLFFDTEKKRYLDSFLDGSGTRGSDKQTLHLLFYYDDFNPLKNALSSSASKHKCSSIYFKILNVSPQLASKRSCVLPFLIFHSKNFKSNKQQIFDLVKKEIDKLSNRTIFINRQTLKFNIVAFACDNLGAHELLGMSSFAATHFCRYCIMSKSEVNEIFEPIADFGRTADSLANDYQVFLQLESNTVKHFNGVCGPNLLDGMLNFCPDPFAFIACVSHDIFEKIAPELITTTISRMHHDKLLNSDEIYNILNKFEYNTRDRQNPINFVSSLAALSASQGRTFARVFLFVLRDHLPKESHLFKGLQHLVNIIDMVFSPYFYHSWLKKLEKEIESLIRFVRVDLNLNVYPKLHFLTHYPKLISLYGPLRLLSTDHFESAHRHFKDQLMTSANHMDIIKTMFKGALYKFSYLYSSNFLSVPYSKMVYSNSPIEELILSDLSKLYPGKTYQSLVSCKWYGFHYKIGFYIYESKSSHSHVFYLVKNIFFTGDSMVLYCSGKDFEYIPENHVYVELPTKKVSCHLIDASDIWINPIEPYMIDGELYLCPEYRYFE